MSNNDSEIRQLKNRVTTLEAKLQRFVSAIGDAKEEAEHALSQTVNNADRISDLDERATALEDGE